MAAPGWVHSYLGRSQLPFDCTTQLEGAVHLVCVDQRRKQPDATMLAAKCTEASIVAQGSVWLIIPDREEVGILCSCAYVCMSV